MMAAARGRGTDLPEWLIAGNSGSTMIQLKVLPNAKRTGLTAITADRVKLKLSSPPVEGKANAQLCKFLAKQLGVSKAAIRIISGETSRLKTVSVRGTTPGDIRERLLAACR